MHRAYNAAICAVLLMITVEVAAAQSSPRRYVEARYQGRAVAARLLVQGEKARLRVSYTDARGRVSQYMLPDAFDSSVGEFAAPTDTPKAIAFYPLAGSPEPLVVVTALEEERETYPWENYFRAVDGRLGPVPWLRWRDKAESDDKRVGTLQNLVLLYHYDQYGTAGGAGAWYNEGRRRYAAYRDGKLTILEYKYPINDFDHEAKATPPPVSLQCVAVYKVEGREYAAPC